MVAQRTFNEFMEICEAVSQSDVRLARSGALSRHADALQREIDDVTSGRKKQTPKPKRKVTRISFIDRSNAKLREESEIDEKFSMAADTSKPQSPRPTKLPRSRERNVGRHDDWKDKPTEWGERPAAGKKLESRARAVVQSQHRQDVETGVRKEEALDEVVVTRSPEVKQRAKNIKRIRDKKDALAALMKHAKLQKQGLADEVEYDGENVDEVLMVTPTSKQKITKTLVRKAVKIEKPDPSDPDYVTKYREYIKSKQRNQIDELFGVKTIKRWKAEADAAEKAKYDDEITRNRKERMNQIGVTKSKQKKSTGGYTVDTRRPEKKVTTFGKGGETRTYKTRGAV